MDMKMPNLTDTADLKNLNAKRWQIKTPNPKFQKSLSDALGVHPIIAQLLINRDITDIEQARQFINANEAQLHDPFLLKDMDKAVARIKQAQLAGESVLIFGDYDVDGVTSSALLRRVFKKIGLKAINYIPHRMDEGYGLNHGIVEFAKEQGIHLSIPTALMASTSLKALMPQSTVIKR